MTFDLARIAAVIGGKLLAPAAAAVVPNGFSTDSRTLQPGDLFIALRGEHFDGRDFIATAAARGACAVLCEETAATDLPTIVVGDALRAYGDLASAWRWQFSLPVVAVTGSSGKTTTKEMLATILALAGPGLKTEGNLNNLIGLPRMLLRLRPEHRWAVLEMGMSERGEIARLAEIAAPRIGVITNVGPAHLATLKSLDGVARAKGELFAALPAGGCAVVNLDDPKVATLPVANGVELLRYGVHPAAEVRAEGIVPAGSRVSFVLHTPAGSAPVTLALAGRHNVANALAATAAALRLDVPLAQIVAGLEAFVAPKARMETVLLPSGVILVEDSYNANPLSVMAALTALDEMGGAGRRIAVLGDMLELGPGSPEWHREVGRTAAKRLDALVVLGNEAAEIAGGAREAGLTEDAVVHAIDHAAALAVLRGWLRPGDRLLVKGSRGMTMERISTPLRGGGEQIDH